MGPDEKGGREQHLKAAVDYRGGEAFGTTRDVKKTVMNESHTGHKDRRT